MKKSGTYFDRFLAARLWQRNPTHQLDCVDHVLHLVGVHLCSDEIPDAYIFVRLLRGNFVDCVEQRLLVECRLIGAARVV